MAGAGGDRATGSRFCSGGFDRDVGVRTCFVVWFFCCFGAICSFVFPYPQHESMYCFSVRLLRSKLSSVIS